MFADSRLLDPVGHDHSVQGGDLMFSRNVHTQAHRFNTLDERFVATAMPLPSVFYSFLRDHEKRLAQSVKHTDRCGVMIAMRYRGVIVNQFEVKVPAA